MCFHRGLVLVTDNNAPVYMYSLEKQTDFIIQILFAFCTEILFKILGNKLCKAIGTLKVTFGQYGRQLHFVVLLWIFKTSNL